MKQLIATYPILFENQQYEFGDELPTHNAEFVAIWIENGTAKWQEEMEEKKNTVKARRITAEVGLTGSAYPSSGMEQDLIGKIPSKQARGVQSEPTTRRRKLSG